MKNDLKMIELLKLLNSDWGAAELRTEENRKAALDVYTAFRKELGSGACTQSQWAYLKFCYTVRKRFDKSVFHFLRYGKTEELFEDYLTLLAKRSIIGRSIEKKWDKPTDLLNFQRLMWETDYLLSYVMHREKYDRSLKSNNLKRSYLEYEGSKYVVSYPQTVLDIFKEDEAQHNNDLMTMYEEICLGIRDVGIVKERNSKKSLIIFEVEKGENQICELRAAGNRLFAPAPTSDVLIWFVNIYMERKCFHFTDFYKLIYTREYSPEEYSWPDGLKEMLYMVDEDFTKSVGGYIWYSIRAR